MLKVNLEGYYWYKDYHIVDGRGNPTEFDDWDIVKVQLYSSGPYKNNPLRMKKPKLMFIRFGIAKLIYVKKSKGIWGLKIRNLKQEILK